MTPQELLKKHLNPPSRWVLTLVALGSFALCQEVQARDPNTPDPVGVGGSFNTADGTNALGNASTGALGNLAFGWFSLFSNTGGSFNTATGAGALLFNTGDSNTAVGAAALLNNATGTNNTAVGTAALSNNTVSQNIRSGSKTLPWVRTHSKPLRAGRPMLTRHWVTQPGSMQQPVAVTSISAPTCLVLLVRATPATSGASLGGRLTPAPLSPCSSMPITNWARRPRHGASSATLNPWTKPVKP